MEIQFALTPEDFFEANVFAMRNTTLPLKLGYWFFRFAFFLGLPIGVLCFCSSAIPALHRYTGSLVTVGALAVVYWFVGFRFKGRVKKAFSAQKLDAELTVTLNEPGYRAIRVDGGGEGRINWELFDKWGETKDIFVLFPNLRTVVTIPKRALTPDQQTELRAMLAAHIPSK